MGVSEPTRPLVTNIVANIIPGEFVPVPNFLQYTKALGPVDDNFLLNGNNISEWLDLSGNGNKRNQATATRQPLFVTSGLINNLPVARFDGTTDFFNETTALRDTVSSDRTMFFVNKIKDNSLSAGTFYAYNVSKDIVAYDSAGNIKHFDGATFRTLVVGDATLFNPWVFTITVQGTTMKAYRNLALQSTITITRPGGAVSFTTGATSQPLKFWEGDMGAALIYDRLLTDPEIAFNQRGFISEWKIV